MTAARPLPAGEPYPDFPMEDYIDGIASFLGGAANVIMQLGLRPVAYGVMESTVTSGSVMHHPFKRLRTTLTYLAVALMGTDEERRLYREAVNGSHRQVRTKPHSPVRYNAFDPNLQLWVAACLYFGFTDLLEKLRGPMDEAIADVFYAYCIRLGTTLQVRPEMWPPNRAAFWQFWDYNLNRLEIDPTMRAYLDDLIDLRMLPKPVQWMTSKFHRFVVGGCLPPQMRDAMHMHWTDKHERNFNRLMRFIGIVNGAMPKPIRMFPMNFYLWDMRRRIRKGLPLV